MNRTTGEINSVPFPEDGYRYPDLDLCKKEEIIDIMKWIRTENGWDASDDVEVYSCPGHKLLVLENDDIEYVDVDIIFD